MEVENSIMPVWRQAFRPLFLGATVFSVFAIGIWGLYLSGALELTLYGGPVFWHAHEMMFGFGGAVIAGFLLTAVQSWTGIRATHGKPLLLIFVVWLLARIGMFAGSSAYGWLIALIDVSFLPLTAYFMTMIVLKSDSHRQLVFLPILLFLALANVLTHLSVLTGNLAYFTWGIYTALILVVLLMTVIGGRVIPEFTANGLGITKTHNTSWIEYPVLLSTCLIVLVYINNAVLWLPGYVLASLFGLACLSNTIRALRWQPWKTFSTPLLWSLHLAYWFIPLGHGLFALHFLDFTISSSSASHSFTAGAMGSIILAMIARVSQGHTGRLLSVGQGMKAGFALIILAGIIRVAGGLFQSTIVVETYLLAALLWVTAYSLYVVLYSRILTTPRPDGKSG